MKIYKGISLILLFCFSIGCEDSQKKNHLSIEIDAIIKENDSIQVFYTTDNSINFNENQTFWKKVNGNKKNQIISMHFPDTIKPKQLRMDFGRNIKQQEIVLNEIIFSYKEKNFSAKGEEIYRLFRVDNSNTSIDKLTGSLKRKDTSKINGPSLYPYSDKVHKTLVLLYSKKSQK